MRTITKASDYEIAIAQCWICGTLVRGKAFVDGEDYRLPCGHAYFSHDGKGQLDTLTPDEIVMAWLIARV